MESERAKFLQEIVNQQFKYIAPEDARPRSVAKVVKAT
jgi:hypothetical protein